MKQLLIVEDDRDLSRGLCLALKDQELQIIPCFDLKSARAQLASCKLDLVLLDINLPDGSGLALLHEIKSKSDLPVILLTANDTEMDVVTGLEYGADDYITKPFSLAILRARVKTQLRHGTHGTAPTSKPLAIGGYRFDFEHMAFFKGDTAIELSKTEQKLLRLLVENRGVTLSRAVLLDRIWTDSADFVDENALSVTVKRLRDKLDAGQYIKTVYGLGYVWVVKRDE
ncbi:MAG TPA: response regulator transcription factor [Clostridiales bacterium]|nr:response regulator transcription factor [Clostridiales bacterium]